MIRAFQNGVRIATAARLPNNAILQVFPEKKPYATEDSWKAEYVDAEFKTEPRHTAAPNMSFMKNLSVIREEDTPMQRIVRQLYFQHSLPDSLGRRVHSGLYVMMPGEGIISTVYFDRKTGAVTFNGKNQVARSTEDLTFFTKNPYTRRGDMYMVDSTMAYPRVGQKMVIYRNMGYSHSDEIVRKIRSAGFHVLFYRDNRKAYLTTVCEKLYSLPGVAAIIENNMRNGLRLYSESCLHTKIDIDDWCKKNSP
jgi:hypothetical protein